MESQNVWSTHGSIPDTRATWWQILSNGLVNLSALFLCVSLMIDALLGALLCDLKMMLYSYSHRSIYIYLLHSSCPQFLSLSPSRPLSNQVSYLPLTEPLCVLPSIYSSFYLKWINRVHGLNLCHWEGFPTLLTFRTVKSYYIPN